MHAYAMSSCLHCEFATCNTIFEPLSLVTSRGYDSLWVVVRRLYHHTYLVMRKYVASREGLWSYPYMGPVSRVLKSYTAQDVASSASTVYEPLYGIDTPVLSCSSVGVYFNPLKFNDYALHGLGPLGFYDLPPGFLELADNGCMYFTGSVLGLSHKDFSDLDIVLNVDSRCLSKIDYFTNELAKHSTLDTDYVAREASNRLLDTSIVATLIPPWQHGIIHGKRRVSVTLVARALRREVERRVFRVGKTVKRLVLHVESRQERAGDYPGVVETTNGPLLLVFDGFYTPALFLGGRFLVRGVEAEIVYNGGETVKALALGVREEYTWIKRL